MVCPIMKDVIFLSQKSVQAVNCEEDRQTAQNLLDTLKENQGKCVGMAANMIGVSKRIIAVDDNGTYLLMYNPEIVKASQSYEAEEGCLSLTGTRTAKRWKTIKVKYENENFQVRFKNFSGWTAQIIQHEIDHCNGIII